jgi:hypothetical protein
MAAKAKSKIETGKSETIKVTFKCRLCGKDKPIEDMRTITRFIPVLIVCQDCAKTLRLIAFSVS